MSERRTTYALATAGYDAEHERQLTAAIMKAIADTSTLTDCSDVMALRTAEASNALLTVLATVLALSPVATRSPSAIRRTVDELGKRLRRRVADPDLQTFARSCF